MNKQITTSEFWSIADNWYQRTINLKNYAFDETKPNEKRIKAFFLWQNMILRMTGITQKAIEISQPKPRNIKHGSKGIAYILSKGKEIILPPTKVDLTNRK